VLPKLPALFHAWVHEVLQSDHQVLGERHQLRLFLVLFCFFVVERRPVRDFLAGLSVPGVLFFAASFVPIRSGFGWRAELTAPTAIPTARALTSARAHFVLLILISEGSQVPSYSFLLPLKRHSKSSTFDADLKWEARSVKHPDAA
jgi:hypothetical protein